MLGSVFSPYYAWARRRGATDPLEHCALNVALYGRGGQRWAMTERSRRQVSQASDRLTIGPSALHWDGQTLSIDIAELTVPLPSRLRGRVRLRPRAINAQDFALDAAERHRWWPIAPVAEVEVEFSHPARSWSGRGYFDSNWGQEPLEDAFVRWDWSRAALQTGGAVLYDVTARQGQGARLALRFDTQGRAELHSPPPRLALPPTRIWRIARATQSEQAADTRVLHTLEDTPFYARSLVGSRLFGEVATSMHESLSLERFAAPWVQVLLPFRMPRRA